MIRAAGLNDWDSLPAAPLAVVVWCSLGLVSLAHVFGSLLPRKRLAALEGASSDGWKMLRALRGPGPSLQVRTCASRQVVARRLIADKRLDEAVAYCERALQEFPHNPGLTHYLFAAHMDRRRYREAVGVLERLLDGTPEEHGPRRARWLNNLAWARLFCRDEADLAKADAESAEAFAAWTWDPAHQSTRGSVLAMRGDVEGAIPLLLRAIGGVTERSHKSSIACFLSLAERQRANAKAGARWQRKAERWEPSNEVLELLRCCVSEGWTPTPPPPMATIATASAVSA
jgi:tetratricopeptide (TPR) repeat protein